jgi:acetyl esterase/lipase
MKRIPGLFLSLFFVTLLLWNLDSIAQLPAEKPLWPDGIPANPVKYNEELVRTSDPATGSLSQMNRVFSCVSVPTYIIHRPAKNNNTGVALVICPGGGFRDVWLDREGNDLGLWLAEKGITSLILKYRTYNTDAEGFNLKRNIYDPEVYADARRAIYILRSNATELNIDKKKIGIAGFSAGGTLALTATIGMYENELPAYARFREADASPDFAGLFYPGLSPGLIIASGTKKTLPPVFIINGGEDTVTPARNCIELYNVLTANKVKVEMHIYAKGGHGFDSGLGRGNGISTWRDSFIAWLRDSGFIKE